MRVFFERLVRVDKTQLSCHTQMNDKEKVILEVDEDVLSAASYTGDTHAGQRVDEDLWLGMPDDAGKVELATHDGAAGEVRPQVGDDGFHLG